MSRRSTLSAALLALAATCAAASGEDGPKLPALLESYRSLRPAAKGIAVEGRTASVGHMEFIFEKGAIFDYHNMRVADGVGDGPAAPQAKP